VSLKNIIKKDKWNRVLAIDPASHSIAWAILSYDKELIATGKIDLTKEKEQSQKFNKIKKELLDVVKTHNPDVAVIEQSVYIQNFQTSRIISYIIGFTWGIISDQCDVIEDVSPLMWKPAIGYKNVSKKDGDVLSKNGKKGSVQVKLKNERKERVREIVSVAFGKDTPGLEDDDIVDAIGIALWYWKVKKNG
jgi:Holliday junction resolvasome RuvABC endonuclease subunit